MRLLIVPIIGINNLNGDSDWHHYASLMRYYSAKHPCFFYILLPIGLIDQGRELLSDLSKNTHFIGLREDLIDFHRDSMNINMPLWRSMFGTGVGKYQVDAIIASRIPCQVMMATAINDMRRRGSIPIFSHDPVPWRVDSDYPFPLAERLMRAMSYAYSYVWVMNEHDNKRIRDFLRRHVSATMLKNYDKNVMVAGRGIDVESLKRIVAQQPPKFKRFSILFGARLNWAKNAKEAFWLMEMLTKMGRDVDCYITQPKDTLSKSTIPDFDRRKNFLKLFVKNCDKERYLKIMPRAHCAICSSVTEGEPKGFIEQLYVLNGLVLFPDRPWARAVLPDNFPWFYKNKADALRILTYFYKNYDEAIKQSSWIRNWIEQNKSSSAVLDREWKRIKRAVELFRTAGCPIAPANGPVTKSKFGSFRNSMFRLADAYKEEGKDIDLGTFRHQLKKIGRTIKFDEEGTVRAPALYAVYVDLLRAGWQDTYDSPVPRLIWPESKKKGNRNASKKETN